MSDNPADTKPTPNATDRLTELLTRTLERLEEARAEREEHLAARMEATTALGMTRTSLNALAKLLKRDPDAAIRAADVLLLPDEAFAAQMLDGDPGHPFSGARAWAANMILIGLDEHFAVNAAENFEEITVDRIGGRYVVTIQRVEGKTPARVAKEALAERDAAILKAAGLAVRLEGALKLLRDRAAGHRKVIERINEADDDPHASVYGNEEQIAREAGTRAQELEDIIAQIEASGGAEGAQGA
jgi:hypothetical protein